MKSAVRFHKVNKSRCAIGYGWSVAIRKSHTEMEYQLDPEPPVISEYPTPECETIYVKGTQDEKGYAKLEYEIAVPDINSANIKAISTRLRALDDDAGALISEVQIVRRNPDGSYDGVVATLEKNVRLHAKGKTAVFFITGKKGEKLRAVIEEFRRAKEKGTSIGTLHLTFALRTSKYSLEVQKPNFVWKQDGSLPSATTLTPSTVNYFIQPRAEDRPAVEAMVESLLPFDVISFDIFDTALVRSVQVPDDVFRLMGLILDVSDFASKRKAAESIARVANDRTKGTREVTLDEIYEVMTARHGATPDWPKLECDLEVNLAQPNRYILEVFNQLRGLGKTLIFTSDMYLPVETIEAMLGKAGYSGWSAIFMSHAYGARKGDGTLQRVVAAAYEAPLSVAHIGDVYSADVDRSLEAGIQGIHYPDRTTPIVREHFVDSLAGSFYQALIYNTMGTGHWARDLHYTHGFRVGGILALGYLEFLQRLVKEQDIEKIIFLGRDCSILANAYERFFGSIPSAYVEVSRAALLLMTAGSNYDDYIGRTFFRWFRDSKNSKPIFQLMQDTGFDFLIEHLEEFDIEPLQFPSNANENHLREFFWAHKDLVEAHHEEARAAADEYFSAAIKDAKTILVVDVGWTGTCISALRSFLCDRKGVDAPKVVGALLGTSRTTSLHDAVSSGRIHPFIYSPAHNIELTTVMMPDGKKPQRERDLKTLPIEYAFTAVDASVVSYGRDPEGKAVPLRGTNRPPNSEQIITMQQGMLDFIEQFLEASKGFAELRRIGPYLAFQPMRSALGKKHYLYAVYRDFLYDAAPVLHGSATNFERFGALFDDNIRQEVQENLGDLPTQSKRNALAKRILFISPEMKYVGAPKSLLRLCKAAQELGYEPLVWTAMAGPFIQEFERVGIEVSVVRPEIIDQRRIDELIRDNVQLVVCNTVVTHKFVQIFEGVLPVVWYVREATNLPDFLRNDPERTETLRKSESVVVVSDYAAQAVKAFAKGKIEVVRNAVEDVSHYALPYSPRKGGKMRFVQLGTIEHRKGYDVFVAAYKAMPPEYQSRAELHFAGGMINSATSFASFILGEIKSEPGIIFHGLIEDERKKIELMSQMDVVVVASRDESCSLVALEGAMLSKPLIVTENVGAKYMVTHRTGAIVPTGDVTALRDAFMRMIDLAEEDLISMGAASRDRYKTSASLEVHKRDLNQLFSRRIKKAPATASRPTELVLSLTSHPPRMQTISACIRSLLAQSKPADRCILWLSEEQFPRKMDDLPPDLTALATGRFEVRWVSDDLGPHKKYLYAMQEFPQSAVITVDDDVEYDPDLVQTLYEAHLQRNYSVIAGRCHLVRFRPDGTLRSYVTWGQEHQNLRGVDTYALIPTGIGGVLYPPGALPVEAFEVPAIKETCLHADDLWLKVMTTLNGYPVFMPHRRFEFRNINGSQNSALWRGNYFGNGNDEAMQRILDHVERRLGASGALSRRMRGVREDGTFVGVHDELDTVPLISTTLRKMGT